MATEEHLPERRYTSHRILRQLLLAIGLVSLISLGYGVRDIMADDANTSANLETIVSSGNAIQLPSLQTQATSRPIVQTAIAMPQLSAQATSRPIVQVAIAMPQLSAQATTSQATSRPIVQTAIAMPQLDTTSLLSSRPVLGSSNTIQVPQLAASSVQSILGVGNDIVEPVLNLAGSDGTGTTQTIELPITGSGSSLNPGTTPTVLILLLLALALTAAGLAIRVHRQIVTAPSLVQRQ